MSIKRRWFQIHLSSIIFVTMFAGALLGLNMCDRDIKSQYQAWYAKDYEKIETWGWPMELGMAGKMFKYYDAAIPAKAADILAAGSEVHMTENGITFRYRNENYWLLVAINIGACLGICIAVVVICEFVIRTLTRRRAVSSQQPTANSQQPP